MRKPKPLIFESELPRLPTAELLEVEARGAGRQLLIVELKRRLAAANALRGIIRTTPGGYLSIIDGDPERAIVAEYDALTKPQEPKP